jgi:sulfite exporter TauE/SafE
METSYLLLASLMTGMAGSIHCVGMCGPIVLAIPFSQGRGKGHAAGKILLYQYGRILTYMSMGVLIGFLGKGISMAGFQQALSIGLGIFFLVAVVMYIIGRSYQVRIPAFDKALYKIKGLMQAFLSRQGLISSLSLGLLNGLLPCGLVYLALAGALATGNPIDGALYMAFFGLGTLPLMLGVSLLGQRIKKYIGGNRPAVFLSISLVMAFLFIMRGLELGIPYLSPVLDAGGVAECH